MIDLHSHILPGVDDGAQTLEDSLEMARKAISQGITHLMCTPHHNNGKYNNPAEKVIQGVADLQKELDQRGLELTLLEGQEVRLTEFLLSAIKRCGADVLSSAESGARSSDCSSRKKRCLSGGAQSPSLIP